ncbi:MAG: hypothetical protein V1850_06960 [Candidatus Bathyarchaeota archaeon]
MPLTPEVLLLAFTLGGVGLKLADLHDRKRRGFIFASISAISMGLLISDSPFSSSIVLGIILGVALAGKIDQPNLIFGLGLALATAVIIGLLFTGFITPDLPLLATFTAAALVDEVGHDKINAGRIFPSFFRFRVTLKTTIILLIIFSQIDLIHAIGFFCFDLSYEIVNVISEYSKKGS